MKVRIRWYKSKHSLLAEDEKKKFKEVVLMNIASFA